MKASLKFREEQKPLISAKLPINVLGIPFQSGVSAGESKEMSLQLATFFDSGPSLKFSYRPNDVYNPFSLIVKSGIGSFGSPNSSSLMMSAEFNLTGRGNPSFFLHFKPKFGDFTIKKSQSSNLVIKDGKTVLKNDESVVHVVDESVMKNGYWPENGVFSGGKFGVLQPESSVGNMIHGMFSGADVKATTNFPVRDNAVVKFRWGVRFPAELRDVLKNGGLGKKRIAVIAFEKIPLLVMDKISIEHVDGKSLKRLNKNAELRDSDAASVNLTEVCFSVKQELKALQVQNLLLRKSVEDLRADFFDDRSLSSARMMHSSSNKCSSGRNEKATTERDMNEEPSKSVKGTSCSSV